MIIVYYRNPTYSSASELDITWPLFDKKTLQYLYIGNNNVTVSSLIGDDHFTFWEQFYSSTGTYI